MHPERVLAPLRGPEWAYRRRARLGVKYVHKKGRVLAGFRERDKPYIADLARCEVLHAAPGRFCRGISPRWSRPWASARKCRRWRWRPAMLRPRWCFACWSRRAPRDLEKIADFGAAHGVQIFLQSGGLDTVRPLRPDYPPLNYAVDGGDVVIEFGPVDFIQVNREINVSMVAAAMDLLQPDRTDTVLDLFCGLGNFTLPLARRAGRVVGVEGDAALVAKARPTPRATALAMRHSSRENLFEPTQFGPWAKRALRSGAARPAARGCLRAAGDAWRIGVRAESCIFPAIRGVWRGMPEILVHAQGFRLTCAGVMDMFPHTTHVESIAVFESRPHEPGSAHGRHRRHRTDAPRTSGC